MSKFETRIANRLDKLGDDAENWNYHDEAEIWRALAERVRVGEFTRKAEVGSDAFITYLDGESLITAMDAIARSRY